MVGNVQLDFKGQALHTQAGCHQGLTLLHPLRVEN